LIFIFLLFPPPLFLHFGPSKDLPPGRKSPVPAAIEEPRHLSAKLHAPCMPFVRARPARLLQLPIHAEEEIEMDPRVEIDSHGLTLPGRERRSNQDQFLVAALQKERAAGAVQPGHRGPDPARRNVQGS
jgi:hypothetical protein